MPNLQVIGTRFFRHRRPHGLRLKRASLKAGASMWATGGDVIGVDRFGASAPGKVVMSEHGFTVENVYERAMKLLDRKRPSRHQMTVEEAVEVWRNEGDPN